MIEEIENLLKRLGLGDRLGASHVQQPDKPGLRGAAFAVPRAIRACARNVQRKNAEFFVASIK